MEIDVYEYKDKYLEEVVKRIVDRKEEIPYFDSKLLHQAVINEMAAADAETGTIEISDNKEVALKQAESRLLEFMEKNFVDVEAKGDLTTDSSQYQDADTGAVGMFDAAQAQDHRCGGLPHLRPQLLQKRVRFLATCKAPAQAKQRDLRGLHLDQFHFQFVPPHDDRSPSRLASPTDGLPPLARAKLHQRDRSYQAGRSH